MPRYSLSLGFFYTELPLEHRFQAARDAGFTAVEFFWPDSPNPTALARAREEAGVEVVLFNMDEGDYAQGERGFAGDPRRVSEWRTSLEAALELAAAVACPRINALTGNEIAPGDRARQLECVVENLRWAAPLAADIGVELLLEPLNAATHPSYLCRRTDEALDLIKRIDAPNVRLQYDVYQAQRGEGDIVATIEASLPFISHIQIADAPSREQPGTGELNFDYILSSIDELGYEGYVGLEYKPGSGDPFAWLPHADRS